MGSGLLSVLLGVRSGAAAIVDQGPGLLLTAGWRLPWILEATLQLLALGPPTLANYFFKVS